MDAHDRLRADAAAAIERAGGSLAVAKAMRPASSPADHQKDKLTIDRYLSGKHSTCKADRLVEWLAAAGCRVRVEKI